MTGTPGNDYRADPEWQAARNWHVADIPGVSATERHHIRLDAIYAMHRIEAASEADPHWSPRPALGLAEVHNAARCRARRRDALIAEAEAINVELAEIAAASAAGLITDRQLAIVSAPLLARRRHLEARRRARRPAVSPEYVELTRKL